MIDIRQVESDNDLARWCEIKTAVVPNEPVTVDQMRASVEPERVLLLADAA